MRLPEITLVVPDGTGVKPVLSGQYLEWPVGSDVVQPVKVVHQNGGTYGLGGAVSAVFGFKRKDTDDLPFFQVEWDITGTNTAEFTFPRSQRQVLAPGRYFVSVAFEDDDTGFADQILLDSRAEVHRIAGDIDAPVSVLPTQDPLARGPAGVANAVIRSAGSAGDVLVFDLNLSAGTPAYRTLVAAGGTDRLSKPMVGVLMADVLIGERQDFATGGGPALSPDVTGLTGADVGPITVDLDLGTLRAALNGELTVGFCDLGGYCHLFPFTVIQ